MTSAAFTLYIDSQFSSPYALSAYVALKEKGQAFDLRKVDLGAQEHTGEMFSQVSLTRRVPTLVHGDFRLAESSAIDEYLEELLPPPAHPRLYPADLRARAVAREVQAWLRSDLVPLREERSTGTVFGPPASTPLSAMAQAAAATLIAAVERLLPAGADHLFGAWSIADTDLAMMLMRLLASGDPVPERVATYAHQQWQRPSVQYWVRQARAQ